MSYIMNLPDTYEEFGRQNGFGETELNDEYAPLAKKYYEMAVVVVNQLVSLTKDDLQSLDRAMGGKKWGLIRTLRWLCKKKLISKEALDTAILMFDEMEMCSDEQFDAFGFIYDLFEDWLREYLMSK